MITQQLLDYIKQCLERGLDQKEIKNSLKSVGWQEKDIDEAFSSVKTSVPYKPSANTNSQQNPISFSLQEKKANKILITFISVISVLILGSGAAFGYFYYLKETPEKVIDKMKIHLVDIKTFECQGEIKTKITMPDAKASFSNFLSDTLFQEPTHQKVDKKTKDFFISFNSQLDVSDSQNPKGSFIFKIKTDALKELTQQENSFDLESRFFNDTLYFKLESLPNSSSFDINILSTFLNNFLANQWLKFEIREDLKDKEMLQNENEKINQLINQAQVFKITEKLANDKIDGTETYHYKFLIDNNELKKRKNILFSDETETNNENLSNKESTEFDKWFESLGNLTGEIWIGKKDYYIYKITILSEPTQLNQIGEQLSITLLFKNYNKPLQIEAPSSAKNLDDIFNEMFNQIDKILNDLFSGQSTLLNINFQSSSTASTTL